MFCRRNSIFFDFRGKMSIPGEKVSMQSKKNYNTEKQLPSGRKKTINNPSLQKDYCRRRLKSEKGVSTNNEAAL
jgi:hypothetical protein